jgi:hypothetical protein
LVQLPLTVPVNCVAVPVAYSVDSGTEVAVTLQVTA